MWEQQALMERTLLPHSMDFLGIIFMDGHWKHHRNSSISEKEKEKKNI
jgi:hypothetical protein